MDNTIQNTPLQEQIQTNIRNVFKGVFVNKQSTSFHLYLCDIDNPNFLNFLKALGEEFSICKDLVTFRLVIPNNEIITENLVRLLKSYEELWYKIVCEQNHLDWFKDQNTSIVDKLLKEHSVRQEAVVWIDWKVSMCELLSSFWSTTTLEALSILRENDRTYDLFKIMVEKAFDFIEKKWTAVSLNIYLADILDPNFFVYLCNMSRRYRIDNSLLTFEIVDWFYKELAPVLVSHLRILKGLWYNISISNLNIVGDYCSDKQWWLLKHLLYWDVIPSSVKIDRDLLVQLSNSLIPGYDKDEDFTKIRKLIIVLKEIWVRVAWILDDWISDYWLLEYLWCNLFQSRKFRFEEL